MQILMTQPIWSILSWWPFITDSVRWQIVENITLPFVELSRWHNFRTPSHIELTLICENVK
jgi:hypothetical protein